MNYEFLKQNNMKKVFTLIVAAAMVFTGCKKDDDPQDSATPPHAASTKTWVFGEQIWSDAIQMPDCNKETFDGGTSEEPKADGRSFTEDGHTYYYYSWPYVDAHKSAMCPSPWRVPALSDYAILVEHVSSSELSSEWGFGGRAESSSMLYVPYYAYYWSSTEISTNEAYGLSNGSTGLGVYTLKHLGFQVRCVK
jgi:hypothetical protein